MKGQRHEIASEALCLEWKRFVRTFSDNREVTGKRERWVCFARHRQPMKQQQQRRANGERGWIGSRCVFERQATTGGTCLPPPPGLAAAPRPAPHQLRCGTSNCGPSGEPLLD